MHNYFVKYGSDRLTAFLFENEDHLVTYLDKDRLDILLTDIKLKPCDVDIMYMEDFSKEFVLADVEVANKVYRYQKASDILRIVCNEMNKKIDMGGSVRTALVGVYSLSGCKEGLQFARAFAKECKSSLLIDAREYGVVHNEQGGFDSLIYYIKQRSEDIANILEHIVVYEDGLRVIVAPFVYTDLLKLDALDYKWFFEKIKDVGLYENLIFNISSGVVGQLELLGLFDTLYVTCDKYNIDTKENFIQVINFVFNDKSVKSCFVDVDRCWEEERYSQVVRGYLQTGIAKEYY